MAARNKRKLAALNKENCAEHPSGNLEQKSKVARSQKDYITQVSEEIEGTITKTLSQETSRTKNCFLGTLARLDDFLMNPLSQGHSETAPDISRNVFSISQGTNEDDTQSNPLPEAGLFNSQVTQNSGPLYGHDMVTGVQREGVGGHDMITRATEQTRNRHDMTGVQEEVTYCSPSTSSGEQKKNRFTSQPQFRSENTPATNEADQILLALQHLANNNHSANFDNNLTEFPNC